MWLGGNVTYTPTSLGRHRFLRHDLDLLRTKCGAVLIYSEYDLLIGVLRTRCGAVLIDYLDLLRTRCGAVLIVVPGTA